MNSSSLEVRVIEGVNFNSLVSLKVHGALYHLSTVDFVWMFKLNQNQPLYVDGGMESYIGLHRRSLAS